MKKLLWTILSFSLLTVMAGAAVAPALGIIAERFPDASPLAIKMLIALPPLSIIAVNLVFDRVCRLARTKTIALAGAVLYVAAGAGAFFAPNLPVLLALRALLGVAVGLLMPLSVGLLAYWFPPEELGRLMGLSAAMNQAGGVVGTLLAGFLATVAWNWAFLVYLLGAVVAAMVALWLPNERLRPADAGTDGAPPPSRAALLRRFHASLAGMLLCTVAFFAFVSNFALAARGMFSTGAVTLVLVGVDVVATAAGLLFGRLLRAAPGGTKYLPPLLFVAGFALLAARPGASGVLAAGALLGFANGIGVPYLNTLASAQGGRGSVTTVLPLLSAALFLGQFVCPPLIDGIASLLPAAPDRAPWLAALAVSLVYLAQAFATRRLQTLPPSPGQNRTEPNP